MEARAEKDGTGSPNGSRETEAKPSAVQRGGKQYRPLSVIRAEIAGAQARLSVLLRERKGALSSIRMRERRHTPKFKASMQRGLDAFWSDPEKRAQQIELRRKNCANHPYHLPKMPPEKRKLYNKLRRSIPRDDALRAVLQP